MQTLQIDLTDIKDKIIQCSHEIIGQHFNFHVGQLDAIAMLVLNALTNVKHTILEAPTGSGKSMIALLTAYVLHKHLKMKSYILVSDLSLFDQYVNDINKLNNDAFGYIKGKENYICYRNKCNVSQAMCSLQNMSPKAMFSCKNFCQYARDYVKAIEAPITLMTYQLYFIQRNYVEDDIFNGHNKNFPKRDLVIADEAHKICDICQAHFAPKISIEHPKWMTTLDKYAYSSMNEYERIDILNRIELCKDNDELIDAVAEYASYVAFYCNLNNEIRHKLASVKTLSNSDRKALAAGNMARQTHCKFDDMLSFIKEYGSTEYVAKTNDGNEITLNFIFDDAMLKKYFHSRSKNEMLMSATIGDFNEYAKLAGLDKKNTKAISMTSTFDFIKSPIFFTNENKMSYDEKDASILKIAKQVEDICNAHSDMRGIIQTGSYANVDALMQNVSRNVSDRCLIYKGSKDKKDALERFLAYGNNQHDNHILVGPTLIEGLNFPDDLCRFQICIKVPYAFLGSEYVKKRMEYVDGWYEYDVLNKLCQGIGRGVRHEKDWCETYILDGCISYLVKKLDKFRALNGRFKRL